jgi:hypothetical protein
VARFGQGAVSIGQRPHGRERSHEAEKTAARYNAGSKLTKKMSFAMAMRFRVVMTDGGVVSELMGGYAGSLSLVSLSAA